MTAAVQAAGYRYSSFGENLFAGTWGQVSARDVVRAWLQSPPHRANLLHPGFRHVGAARAGARPPRRRRRGRVDRDVRLSALAGIARTGGNDRPCEESHLDEMRSAIRGDFERLAERRGEQELLRVSGEEEDPEAVAEEHEEEPRRSRSWLARLFSP